MHAHSSRMEKIDEKKVTELYDRTTEMAQSLQTRDWIKWTGPWGDYGSTRKSLNICILRVPKGMMKKNSKK